jgi:NitT/TauT family transport system ATP-binding protein
LASDVKIRIRGLRKHFAARFGQIEALDGLDLEVRDGELCVIVGPSGCGKSTLLRILAGLERADAGQIEIGGSEDADGRAFPGFRREATRRPISKGRRPLTAMVFQEPSALPWMTVRANVGYGLRMQGRSAAECAPIVDRYLEKVQLTRFARAYPHQLSGGMKQRVSVARAFAADPEILLMDEPFGSLDEQTRVALQDELLRLFEDSRKTIVFVTHSIDEALTLGDRVLVMSPAPGRILRALPVPFPRPRRVIDLRTDPAYGRYVADIWALLGYGRVADAAAT